MIVPKTREGQGQQQPEVRQKVNNSNRVFLRLPSSYIPFFQAMATDYYQRGNIESPSIGLLAKTCLITAGKAWNRMQIQLVNKEYQRKMQQQQQQQQIYQQGLEFVQSSGNIALQSVATNRPPMFVVKETKRQLQQDAGNLVNRSMTERGYPAFNPGLDGSSMDRRRRQQPQSQPQPEDQFYHDETNGEPAGR